MKKLFLFIAIAAFTSCMKEENVIKTEPQHLTSIYKTLTDTTANAYFSRCSAAGITIDSLHQVYITNLMVRLKSETGLDGVTSQFNSLDVLYLFTEPKTVAGYNLLQNNYNATISLDYAGSHTYGKGFKGKNGYFRMDSHFNPFDGLATYNFTRNSNSFGCYVNTNTREVCGLISNLDGSSNGYELKTYTTGATSINGNTTSVLSTAPDCTGSFASERTSSTSMNTYKNGKASAANSTAATSATVNKSFKLFQRDINGTYSLGTNNRIAYVWFGSGNVDIKKLDRAIIEEYLKPIGAALTKLVAFDGNSYISTPDFPTKLMDKLWQNGVECTSFFNGVSGINIGTMTTNLPTLVQPYHENYFDKQAFIFWEISNTLKGTGTVADTWSKMQTYVSTVKGYGFQNICVNTCMPFKTLTPSKRSDTTNYDNQSTINGLIRVHYSDVLGADYFIDCGSDPLMKDSYGVCGIGEKNTAACLVTNPRFNNDEQHLASTGTTWLVNNYLYNEIYSIIH